jgi:hypothetical protein
MSTDGTSGSYQASPHTRAALAKPRQHGALAQRTREAEGHVRPTLQRPGSSLCQRADMSPSVSRQLSALEAYRASLLHQIHCAC